MENEVWKDIAGYEGKYQVSNIGNVKSLNYRHTGKEKVLKGIKHTDGYLVVGLCKYGKTKRWSIHRLVATAFIENPNCYSEVNHKDECKTNNCVHNLEWCDRHYNITFGTRNEKVAKALSKKVYQYTISGELVKVWDSVKSDGQDHKFSRGNISQCCNGKRKNHKGYVWSYKPL